MNASNRSARILLCLVPFLLLFAFSSRLVHGKSDSLAALESAIQKQTANPKTSAAQQRYRAALVLLSQLHEAIDRNDPRQTAAALGEISALFESEAVRAAARKLGVELRVEQTAKGNKRLARVSSVLANAAAAVQAARRAADLDVPVHDLGDLMNHQDSDSPEARNELERIQNTRAFVFLWQDYLAANEAGDSPRALAALRDASRLTPDLIERSQILALIDEVSKRKQPDANEPACSIVAQIKTLEDIPEALDALAALEPMPGVSAGDYRGLVETLRHELSRISQVYREYRAGLPTALQISRFDSPTPNEETFRFVLPLRVQLLRTIIPRSLEVDENLKPNAEEPIRDYLDRVTASAVEKGELRLLVRARDLRSKLDGVLSSANDSLSQFLLAGLNQEEAEQWVAAVVSYETALKYGADAVLAKHIGMRLEKMKAAHANEFEEGFQRFMTANRSWSATNTTGSVDAIKIPGTPH